MTTSTPAPQPWWQTAVFYQIYPRSFADGNGDGHGDLHGAIERLGHLADLGIGAVWISPHYPSPNADWGYDVSDYTGVHPDFGDLDTFRRFLDEAHARDIRVVLDLVINHTSSQHPWFQASRVAKDDPKRDWYVWHPGRVGDDGEPVPPNNWQSVFGGPAWRFDEATGEFYYHFFLPEQPDLNWHNPAVREAFFDQVRFWLDLGIDGWRIDAIGTLFEDPGMSDHSADFDVVDLVNRRLAGWTDPDEEDWAELFGHQTDHPMVHEVLRELRAVCDEYDDIVLVGETDDVTYHGDGWNQLHMVFNFPLMRENPLTPEAVIANQTERLPLIPEGSWPCTTLDNHDADRARSSFQDPSIEFAKVAAALTLTLPGTPSLYNGEEIGMEDLLLDSVEAMRDPIGPWFYETAIERLGLDPADALERAARFTRDRCRTPMQWDSGPNAGFSPAGLDPWLPVHPNHRDGITVADQEGVDGSLLEHYRALIALRRRLPALTAGRFEPVLQDDEDVLVFRRPHSEGSVVVALNFGVRAVGAEIPPGEVVFSTEDAPASGRLAPYEVRITATNGNA